MLLVLLVISSCGDRSSRNEGKSYFGLTTDSVSDIDSEAGLRTAITMLVSPKNPQPGQVFRVISAGGKNILKARLVVNSPDGSDESVKSRIGDQFPYWRIDEFSGRPAGKYQVNLIVNKQIAANLEFSVSLKPFTQPNGVPWKTLRGWGSDTEALYSSWINALFYDAGERSSWSALHEVTQNRDNNFLYDYLSLKEDNPSEKNRVVMEPDCADNPFYFRAYFAWKLGLPFGYHECDRGNPGRPPRAGRWITNETATSKSNPVLAFNAFLRRVMDGVHSGTARTALKDENTDYYPVPLTKNALRAGVVFADPYGHTLILVRSIQQSVNGPGALLSVDAQPDGTVGIKRFWKGNFLFNTSEVIGEPGFKAFRPIILNGDQFTLLKNKELSPKSGLIPFSLQQKGMPEDVFYHTMEQIINPKPLDPEMALLDLIQALHEQLIVRVSSVAGGENYMKTHPGEVIAMPGNLSGVFQAGGLWEDFSTPNRDLRLLIAIDAVLGFPDKIIRSPEDFKIPLFHSPEQVKKKLEALLSDKLSELSITYNRSDGSHQTLTLQEIIKRRAAFEMAYNPNDGIEIRWGAPENSEERATCHRHVSAGQLEKMRSVRKWFQKRLHPPT